MARAIPNVFSIAPGLDFARELARAVLDGDIGLPAMRHDPLRLADLVIHVPTRRMGKMLEQAFAREAGGSFILPQIHPLGDARDDREPAEDLDLPLDPAAVRRLVTVDERRFLLLPLVSDWLDGVHRRRAGGAARSDAPAARAAFMAEALTLATALGGLIDEMAIEGVPLSTLGAIDPAAFDPSGHDEYWWMTRDFLALAARNWPETLLRRGAEDHQGRQLRLIRTQAQRLMEADDDRPVIVAGSTGSVRATADLMRVVSRLRNGAVILPGLDQSLEEGEGAGWSLIGEEAASYATRFAHGQASLKRTLDALGIARVDVQALGAASDSLLARNRLLSEAMRPAETTARWPAARQEIAMEAALAGIACISAPDERLEALAIAIAMRETLDEPGKRVALVTADRRLAARVSEELRRWRIEASDSAPVKLRDTSIGVLIRLLLEAMATPDAASLLGLLKHPLVRLGESQSRFAELLDAMELLVWRGRRFHADMRCEARVIAAFTDPDRRDGMAAMRIDDTTRLALPAFAKTLDDLLDHLGDGGRDVPLAILIERLIAVLHQLAMDEAGESLIEMAPEWPRLRDSLLRLAEHGGETVVPPAALAAILELVLAEGSLPPPEQGHPRALILGLLEARLLAVDRVIIGGLNEGSLPPAVDADPFLNRAMRIAIGLQPPERRIGQSAHDVMMLAGHADLVLSHAKRVGTQPGIPSRFLQRLAAFAGKEGWNGVTARGARLIGIAEQLDRPEGRPRSIAPPDIRPAEPRIPKKLSVTEIETLKRDPYALYARHLLGLEPLEALDAEPGARERGTILHRILEIYSRNEPPADPERAALHLREIGRDAFHPIAAMRERHHFWWQGFEAIIPGFVALDRAARDAGRQLLLEARAQEEITLPHGLAIFVAGRIDRIEIERDGAVHLIDFKSGKPPSAPKVYAGFAPQLVISAALVQAGGVSGLNPGTHVASIAYVPVDGKHEVEANALTSKDMTLAEAVERQRDWLVSTLDDFAAGRRGWQSRLAPAVADRAGDYDHLARVGEWSIASEDDAGEEDG